MVFAWLNRPILEAITLAATLCFTNPAVATDYYVSATGNDRLDGRTSETAWGTLHQVNAVNLRPGDRVYLQAGEILAGSLIFDTEDRGTKDNPIVVTSHGAGRATINAGTESGIVAMNTAGILISRINIIGNDRDHNTADGVQFYTDLPRNTKLEKIEITEVDISGFGKNGVSIGAWNGQSGYRDVRITQAVIHDNGLSGIITYGYAPYAHERVYIGYVECFNNSGRTKSFPNNNSGTGIVLGGVKGGTIEWSIAHHNGWAGDAGIGIWAYDSTGILIQRNESYDNRTAGLHDGGGFALDGGVTDSILQYNYSHGNDGAGYGLFQYKNAPPWSGNKVRFNLSIHDGQKNGSGGIHVWSGGSPLHYAEIVENVVVIGMASRDPSSALLFDAKTQRFSVENNLLMTFGDAPVVSISSDHGAPDFLGNRCWSKKRAIIWTLWVNDQFCEVNHNF